MTTFEYKGYDAAGQAQSGLIEAADLTQRFVQNPLAGVPKRWVAEIVSQREVDRTTLVPEYAPISLT